MSMGLQTLEEWMNSDELTDHPAIGSGRTIARRMCILEWTMSGDQLGDALGC